MFLTPYKRHAVSVLAAATLLSGCGLTQRVTDGTKEVASAIFYKQIKTLHLDFVSRSALNTDAQDTPLSTMLHVWQLKTRERFDEANYDTLLMQEEKTLKSDVLAKHTVWMKPAGAVSLNVPLDKETQFVAIVGQFYHPDEQSNSWRLALKRDELEADRPRTIELMRSDLRLLPLQDK
ncbi:type VI secretion system lipoprotein TssJ [Klebsiella variicola]|uniref:type VI secretion system lipoprotein TssJ n=1 Tax=Klebsiella variicola TaxID=244366 RepID=UPI001BD44A92|nr:type VI secretion system lipoprotein TssJ [Klebsiella variicola]